MVTRVCTFERFKEPADGKVTREFRINNPHALLIGTYEGNQLIELDVKVDEKTASYTLRNISEAYALLADDIEEFVEDFREEDVEAKFEFVKKEDGYPVFRLNSN